MSESNENQTNSTMSEAELLVEFFKNGGNLTKACAETGLDYKSMRRSLNAPLENMRLGHIITLTKWRILWEESEIERRNLSKKANK